MGKSEAGLGSVGQCQISRLEKDFGGLSDSTPIIVFAHVPLWEIYRRWGWGTTDGATALGFLKRFGSVSVLNGHIHQVVQKVEGNITFHTAMSSAFPQPAPGTAPKAGPMKVPADQLKKVVGITTVKFVGTPQSLDGIGNPVVSDERRKRVGKVVDTRERPAPPRLL